MASLLSPMAFNRGKQKFYLLQKESEGSCQKECVSKKVNKTEESKEYRAELNRERRKRGIYGKGGKDVSHKKDGSVTLESRRTNRARNGANGKSTKK